MHWSDSQRALCLEAAASIAENLLDRAKAHRGELYWDLGSFARSGRDRRILELSLGFGTPGILLFLAEYYRRTQDAAILAAIHAAQARLERLIARAPEQHVGFYSGAIGCCYALREVGRLTGIVWGGGGPAAWTLRALDSYRTVAPRTVGSGLSHGIAGCLLGLELMADDLPAARVASHRDSLLGQLVQQLRPAPHGLACGSHFDAIEAPLGFFSGSAGVRHVLRWYHRGSSGVRWIESEMGRHETAAFDPATGNWPDYINEDYFDGAAHARRLNRAIARGVMTPFEQPGDTIWWGAGTAGMLLGHLPTEDGMPATGEASAGDARALALGRAKIGAALARLDAAEDKFTLYDGWGGVALSLAHGRAVTAGADVDEPVRAIIAAALAQFQQHGRFKTCAWNQASRLGILVGEAGVGYCLLRLLDGAGAHSIVRPMPAQVPANAAARLEAADAGRAILTQTFPLTSRMVAAENLHVPLEISTAACLATMRDAVNRAGKNGVVEVLSYETDRIKLGNEFRSSLYLASREAFRQEIYGQIFAACDDELILRGRFRRVRETRIGVVPFGLPEREGGLPVDGRLTPMLLQARASGVQAVVLTREAYYVLLRLNVVESPRRLIADGARQWPLCEHAPEEIQKIVLATIRAGLADGFIARKRDA